MCRHIGYLGPPVTLAELLLDRPHGLVRQSWAPRDMRAGGTVNADGFGAGWYPGQGSGPVRYRRATPIWSDVGFAELAGTVRAGAVLAAVRSATEGMPVVETAAAPFCSDGMLFSHNGVVRGWPESVAGLAAALSTTELMTLDAPVDSALLWALVRSRVRVGQDLAKAVAEVVLEVAHAAPGSRLNVVVTDGTTLVATTWTHALSVLRTPGSVTLSSEPLDDDPRWRPVPDRHLVVATAGEVQLHEMENSRR